MAMLQRDMPFNLDLVPNRDQLVDVDGNNLMHYFCDYFTKLRNNYYNTHDKVNLIFKQLSAKIDIKYLGSQLNNDGYSPVHYCASQLDVL